MGTYVVALSLSRVLNAFSHVRHYGAVPKAVSQSSEAIREMTQPRHEMSSLLTASAGILIVALGPNCWHFIWIRLPQCECGAAHFGCRSCFFRRDLVLSQAFMAMGRPGRFTVFS